MKELYPLYIKPPAHGNMNDPGHPFNWLGPTIANALSEHRALPQYQDSPAHENVRRLGPSATYFDRIPAQSGILWLCPFGPSYMQKLGGAKVQVAIKKAFGLETRFERITDIVSPQLVSQRLYGALRRRDMCVVDWTGWSANVFYELGVRLAVNRFATISLLAGNLDSLRGDGKKPSKAEIAQRTRLLKLLSPIKYSPDDATSLDEIKERYRRIIDHAAAPDDIPPAWGDIAYDYVYRLIADLTTPASAESEQVVAQLLVSQAGIRTGTSGTTNFSSPVLYGDTSEAVKNDAEATATEMLMAAWYYLSERCGLKEIQHERLDEEDYRARVRSFMDLGDRLIPLLKRSKSQKDVSLSTRIESTIDAHRRTLRKGGFKPSVGS